MAVDDARRGWEQRMAVAPTAPKVTNIPISPPTTKVVAEEVPKPVIKPKGPAWDPEGIFSEEQRQTYRGTEGLNPSQVAQGWYSDYWGGVKQEVQKEVTKEPTTVDPLGLDPVRGTYGYQEEGGARPGYDASETKWGMPRNYAEATIALNYARKQAGNVFFVQGVGWIDGDAAEKDPAGTLKENASRITYDPAGNPDYSRVMASQEQIQSAMYRQELQKYSQDLMNQVVEQRGQEFARSRSEAYSTAQFERETSYNAQVQQANNQFNLALQMAADEAEKQQIKLQHGLSLDRLKKDQEFSINVLTEELQAEEVRASRREDFDFNIQEIRFQHDEDIAAAQNQFRAEEAELDRAIERGELVEAKRHAMAIESIQRGQLQSEQKRLSLDIVSMLGERPEMFFFGKQTGLFNLLGDVMGDGGEMIEGMVQDAQDDLETIDKVPNIQEFKKMSNIDQRIELFRIRAQEGLTGEGAVRHLRGAAPFDRSALANLAQSIGAGSAATQRQFPQLFPEGVPGGTALQPGAVDDPWAEFKEGGKFGTPRIIVDPTAVPDPTQVTKVEEVTKPSPTVTAPPISQATAEMVPSQQITMVRNKAGKNVPVLLTDLVHLQSKALTVEQATAKIDVRKDFEGRAGNTYFIKPRQRVAV